MIFTKKGDKGYTELNGKKLLKSAQIFDVLGSIDELSSWIGLVSKKSKHFKIFEKIQKNLEKINSFIIGYDVVIDNVEELEKYCGILKVKLENHFVLPGNESEISAKFDICRTLCRKVERKIVKLKGKTNIDKIIQYINRLSDLLFLFARNNEKN